LRQLGVLVFTPKGEAQAPKYAPENNTPAEPFSAKMSTVEFALNTLWTLGHIDVTAELQDNK